MTTNASIFTQDSVAGVVNNKQFIFRRGDPVFGEIVNSLKKNDWKAVEKFTDRKTALAQYMDNKVVVADGLVKFNGQVVHNVVADRILSFMRDGLPYKPLVKFLNRLMLNKDERCVEALYNFMEQNDIPLDSNGNIVAYKSLNAEGKGLVDWFSGNVKHAVGKTIRWGQRKNERPITDNDYGNECSNIGFHVGNWEYGSTFNQGKNHQVLGLVRIDPAKVISLPDGGGMMHKMRVLEYTVLALYKDSRPIRKQLVYSKVLKKIAKTLKPKVRKDRVKVGKR